MVQNFSYFKFGTLEQLYNDCDRHTKLISDLSLKNFSSSPTDTLIPFYVPY